MQQASDCNLSWRLVARYILRYGFVHFSRFLILKSRQMFVRIKSFVYRHLTPGFACVEGTYHLTPRPPKYHIKGGLVCILLEAQLLCNQIDVTPSPTYSLSTSHLAFSNIYPLLWIDFDVIYSFAIYNLIRKPFLMVAGVKMPSIGGGF